MIVSMYDYIIPDIKKRLKRRGVDEIAKVTKRRHWADLDPATRPLSYLPRNAHTNSVGSLLSAE